MQYIVTHSKVNYGKLTALLAPAAVGLSLLLWYVFANSGSLPSVPLTLHGTYTTSFPIAENPISEGGTWINGRTVGLDWSDVRTASGLAFGTDSGTRRYADSTALLAGTWGPDQTIQATVHTVNQNDQIYEEVELRLRSSLSRGRNTGYEINFRCSKKEKAYAQIVRWNGRLGSFTYLNNAQGSRYGVTNGDRVKAMIIGNVITAYINDVQVLRAVDRTYANGNPGMGFYLEGATGVNEDFGFADFTATDTPASAVNISNRPQ